MKAHILFILFLIFISNFVAADTLSISPTQIDFIGLINEKICNEITIKTDGSKNLIGEDRWASFGETRRKFTVHNLSSDEIGLKLDYDKILIVSNETRMEICLEGKNLGIYHGLLLYKIDSNPTGVGIWMNVSLSKGDSITKIVGNVIGGTKESSKLNFALMGSLVLGIIFVFLIFKLKLQFKKKISN